MESPDLKPIHLAAVRAGVALLVGVVVGPVVAVETRWEHVLAGWIAAAAVYTGWTWIYVWPMDGDRTKSHASGEDPTRVWTHAIMSLAIAASIAGVAHLLIAGSTTGAESIAAASIGVASVTAAWGVVHTVFALHYAKLYYSDSPGCIDFNQDSPTYSDFAYLAFTIGMAYAVSDTPLQSSAIRKKALWHALVSYVLGAIVLAVTINLLAGLGPRIQSK